MSRQQLKEKGFTIIEVVLVLAIAALIFLMVFIALPALQRNQRDQDRKTVVGKVASAVTTYQSNKRGNNPTKGADLQGYVDGTTPTGSGDVNDTIIGNEYTVKIKQYSKEDDPGSAAVDVIQVIIGAKCNTTGDSSIKGTTRQAAVMVKLENGDSIFCQDV